MAERLLINPTPYTRNPKPEIPTPKPSSSFKLTDSCVLKLMTSPKVAIWSSDDGKK